ncbi:hypothetical protein K7432_017979, partial [Basidiobolus ranarum]
MPSSSKKYSKPSLYRHFRGNEDSKSSKYTSWDGQKKDLFFEPCVDEKFFVTQSEAGPHRKGSKNSLEELSNGKKFPTPSKARRYWMLTSNIFSFFIPDLLLKSFGKKDADSRQSLREKITLILFICTLSFLFFAWIELAPYTYCTPFNFFSPEELSGSKYVAINGKVADLSHSTSNVGEEVKRYLGKDVSPMFPSFTLLARTKGATEYPDAEINRCIKNLTKADNWLERRIFNDPGYLVTNQKLTECPSPNDRNKSSTHCFYNISVRYEVAKATIGDLVFDYSILG